MSDARRRARQIPSVHVLAEELADCGLPHALMVAVIRRRTEQLRASLDDGGPFPSGDEIRQTVAADLHHLARSRLQPVINATGVLLHTNLGRAPLGSVAGDEIAALAGGYSNVELDLETGERGGRGSFVETCAAVLAAADAAAVVNNCAAALLLAIASHLDETRREVVVSRGELVQIGGGFRIPEIIEAAGAQLREVGTTNQTTVDDYQAAVGPRTALVLAVHRSNFSMEGFVATPRRAELARVAHEAGLPLLVDLGSGALAPTDRAGALPHEPLPAEVLRDGATMVCFSGDKLAGGPQCGVLTGGQDAVGRCRQAPLYRAVRCGKLTLAALQSTLLAHLEARGDASEVDRLLHTPTDALRRRAQSLMTETRRAGNAVPAEVTVAASTGRVGGGTLPTAELPSVALALADERLPPQAILDRLRAASPPVIARIGGGRVLVDLFAVLPEQDDALCQAILSALGPVDGD